MKKFRNIFLLLFLFIPLAFTGCKEEKGSVSTPNIVEIKGGTIVFNSIKNAEYYTISINGNEIIIYPDQSSYVEVEGDVIRYDASKIFAVGDNYTVKIKANNSDHSSSYSEVYSYKHSGTITQPTNVRINSTTLTWDAVKDVSYYTVKIISPRDIDIRDKNNNPLPAVTTSTIANADLTEYHFYSNSFDFTSILRYAGKYEFYLCSVVADSGLHIESDYCNPISYINTVELETPTNGKIYKHNNELHLTTLFDPNANAISIACGGIEKTAEIGAAEPSINVLAKNYLDINLNQYFASFINAGNLNFDNLTTYSFTTQAKYVSANPQLCYYINSDISNNVVFVNTQKLNAPTVTITETANSSHVLSWESLETEHITGYKVLVCLPDKVEEYPMDLSVSTILLPDNVVAASVQAIGKGNYLTSSFSDFVYPSTATEEISPRITANNGKLTWAQTADAYSVLLLDTTYRVVEDSTYNLQPEDLELGKINIRLNVMKQGCFSQTANTTLTKQLNTPTYTQDQGFTSSNIYELTFTGSENAIGYYVYVKGQGSNSFMRIPTLFTSTRIDLTNTLITEGAYINYQIKVVAVAEANSAYSNSDINSATSKNVSHIQILKTPEYIYNTEGTPVIKEISGGTTRYFLQFEGVDDAESYEILINFNRLIVPAASGTKTYKVDVSTYLSAANDYEIKLRALPTESAKSVMASEYALTDYQTQKQLQTVTNIQVVENEGIYTLSFDSVANADQYEVRIIKENDHSTLVYTKHSLDVTPYLEDAGIYYFYVTAKAPKDTYYLDSNESLTYATVSKLITLSVPKNVIHENVDKNTYRLSWTGDQHADYYRVKLIDPNNIVHEFNSYDISFNINNFMTIQGDYNVSIYSMVTATSENAKAYESSSATTYSWNYTYTTEQDFLRYSVPMHGSYYNYVVQDVQDLKNLLWHHYLFGIGNEGLRMMIKHGEGTISDTFTSLSFEQAIIALSIEATELELYNFVGTNRNLDSIVNNYEKDVDENSGDSTWWNHVKQANINNMFSYLCEQLLGIYPEFNVLDNFSLEIITEEAHETIVKLNYVNKLNTTKVAAPSNAVRTLDNYGSAFNYLDVNSRKSADALFAIDSRPEMLVTTTEQLLQAVQHNRKPKFFGESAIAEEVYNNAKYVLSAIVTNNMTDLEKVTAIFDWLEANFDLTYYYNQSLYLSGAVEKENLEDLETYGLYKIYYLEGIFDSQTLTINKTTGQIIINSNLATSWSYSKAFALLCAIEGIDSKIIYGSYDFLDTHIGENATADHVWNKVYLSTASAGSSRTEKTWYVVDLTQSDNRIRFNNLSKGYGISSHSHFLVSDVHVQNKTYVNEANGEPYEYAEIALVEKTHLISKEYKTNLTCNLSTDTVYNYYENSSFGLAYSQISKTIPLSNTDKQNVKGFNYSKLYHADQTYQEYSKARNYGELLKYLFNASIHAKYLADQNPNGRAVIEFSFKFSENGNKQYINDYLPSFNGMLEKHIDGNYNLNLQLAAKEAENTVYTIVNPYSGVSTVVIVVEKVVYETE